MRADRLIEEVQSRIIRVDIVEFLANHQVGEEAAMGRGEIGSEERHLERVVEPVVVGLLRAEIAGGGAEMNVPAAPVEAGDVGAELNAFEALVLRVGAGRRGSIAAAI